MYTVTNFKTKKALKEAFAAGTKIEVFQPGPFPGQENGQIVLEGPHYPKPHTWYCGAIIENNVIIKLLK